MPYRFLDHTADVLVECTGTSAPLLFASTAEALYAIALNHVPRVVEGLEREVRVTGAGYEDLLIRWLQELIYLLDVEHFAAAAFALEIMADEAAEEYVARGRLQGECCGADGRALEVKSATYHELEVVREGDIWRARVLFDL